MTASTGDSGDEEGYSRTGAQSSITRLRLPTRSARPAQAVKIKRSVDNIGTAGSRGTPYERMRVRLLGQYLQITVGALALTEAVAFVLAFYAAIMARFGLSFGEFAMIELGYGSLWPRALLFSLVMLVSLLAFGLYSA